MRRSVSGAVLALVVVATVAGCSADAAPGDDHVGSSSEAIIGTQRDASMYSEAVLVSVNNSESDFCSGVLVAPRVVLTASHCVSFNPDDDGVGPHGTWSVKAPFASPAQTVTASSGEPFDPVFLSLDVDSYDSHDASFHDLAFVYLDKAITGFTTPTFSSTLYANGTTVSAVGRDQVVLDANLVLSAKVSLLGIDTSSYPNDNRTTRVTDGGDSGGPLFLDGTHTLVGTETRFDPGASLDYWTNFSATVVAVIERMEAQHTGAVNDPVFDFQEMVSTALCARAATCCRGNGTSYVGSPTKCRDDYEGLGFDGTARNLLLASGAHLSISATAKSSCLIAIGDTSSCTSSSTGASGTTNKQELANCIAAINGSVATGGSCVTSAQCSTSSVCVHAANGTGSCQALHATGASCEVLDKSGSEDDRYDLAQELCSNRAGGATGNYCDGYDFVGGAYKAESTWTCKAASATTGTACGTDAACSTNVCAPVDAATGALTCVASTPFVNTDVCSAFQ